MNVPAESTAPRPLHPILIIAALLGASAVGAGAFGAHGLREQVEPRMLEVWQTAARYQMYHAIALFAVGWIHARTGRRSASVSGWLMVAGTLIFSGTLYALVLSGVKILGAITPIGGVLLIIGWLTLAWTVFAARRGGQV